MIIVYPMLTSESISPNVLPGIVKAVEKYILLYNTDEVLKAAGGTPAGKIMSTGASEVGKIVAGALGAAAAVGAGAMAHKYLTQAQDNTTKDGESLSEVKPQTLKVPAPTAGGDVKITVKPPAAASKTSLDIPRGDAVSLEPTWLQITTKNKGLQILGVKVVPFRIKSSEPITSLITSDKQLKFLSYLALKYGRGITRVFFRIMKKMRIPILKDKPITGDPRKDVLLGQSVYGKNMFICMNQMDLNNDEIFSIPANVQKVQKLGWASFIIVDDVNRRATFCMKEFKGVCSVVPFNYIFTSVGKDMNQAYEDLEDLKKASGPFFNMRTNRRKAFSESKTSVDKYLELIQGK
jgi:hypothetical protein